MLATALRRPLVGLALCYGAGTWLGLQFVAPITSLLIASLAAWLGAALLLAGNSRAARSRGGAAGGPIMCVSVLVGVAVALTAWLAARVHPLNNTATGPSGVGELLGRKVEVEGVVTDDPSVTAGMGGKTVESRFSFRVDRLREDGGPWGVRRARVQVLWRGPEKGWIPRYGELWRLKGTVRTWERAGDEVDDTLGRRIHLRANGFDSRFLAEGCGWWLAESCYAARRAAARYLSVGIEDHPDAIALLNALLLGYRTQLPAATKQAFALTGTLHIFAISGSHVVVMAGLIIFVLNAVGISRLRWIVVLAPLLIAYTLATGMQASAARACLMAIVCWAAAWVGRRADTLSALAFSGLVILAVSPTQLMDLGFILSFAVVLGLILLYPRFNVPLRRLLEPDPLRIQPEYRWVTALRAGGREFGSLLAASTAAWVASVPLTAYCFDTFSPVSLPANLAIVPLAFLSVLAGCLSLVLGPCVAFLADVFNHANVAVMGLMVWITQEAAGVPFGVFAIPRPPLWTLAAWYGAIGVWLLWDRARRGEATGGIN